MWIRRWKMKVPGFKLMTCRTEAESFTARPTQCFLKLLNRQKSMLLMPPGITDLGSFLRKVYVHFGWLMSLANAPIHCLRSPAHIDTIIPCIQVPGSTIKFVLKIAKSPQTVQWVVASICSRRSIGTYNEPVGDNRGNCIFSYNASIISSFWFPVRLPMTPPIT